MSNELALPIATDLTVYATDPREMAQAQHGMVAWCQRKMDEASRQRDEFEANTLRVTEAGWPREATKWRRQVTKAARRVEFYEKLKIALEAGYLIVPPLPFQAFAIRTKNAWPRGGSLPAGHDHQQSAEMLKAGVGEYQNPFPEVYRHEERHTDAKGQQQVTRWTTHGAFRPIDFPFALVRPEILNATTKAMALKAFDALGVLPRYRAPDPIVVGEIISPTGNRIHFFVAWWLDPEKLK